MRTSLTLTGMRHSTVRGESAREGGMTLILALGMLCVLMMIMLTLAMASRTERQAASLNADVIRTRMLAESAIEEVAGRLEQEFASRMYPGDAFVGALRTSQWSGGRYLSTGASDPDTGGIADALAVELNGLTYTPRTPLTPGTGWQPVYTNRYFDTSAGGTSRSVVAGRYAYVVIDESGKVDPSAVVSSRRPENGGLEKTGECADELDLGDFGVYNADRFRPAKVSVGDPGKLPADERWFSVEHMVKSVGLTETDMMATRDELYPFSHDREIFWRDADDSKTWSDGEDEPRRNLLAAANYKPGALYDLLVGADKASTKDDVEWLKRQCAEGFGKDLQTGSNGVSAAAAARRIAAQTTLNIKDYGDADAERTVAHLDSAGNLVLCDHVNAPDACAGASHFRGVEKQWNISAIAMRIYVEEISNIVREWERNISINPNTSVAQQFRLAVCARHDPNVGDAPLPAYNTAGPGKYLLEKEEQPDGTFEYNPVYNPNGYVRKDTDGDGLVDTPGVYYGGRWYPLTYIQAEKDPLKEWVINPDFIKQKVDVTIQSDFTYNGYVWYTQFKCKADGRDFQLDGLYNELATSVCWKISKYLDPTQPNENERVPVQIDFWSLQDNTSGSMGLWWIGIPDQDFSLNDTPADGGFRFRPAFKVQAHYPFRPGPNNNQVSFSTGNGSLTVEEECVPIVTILGAEATMPNLTYTMPVTASIKSGGTTTRPWGTAGTDPEAASVNDRLNPRRAVGTKCPAKGTVALDAKCWLRSGDAWKELQPMDSASHVKVLRNGDTFPAMKEPGEAVRDFVVGGKVVLAENQALFLYELTDNAIGTNSDFQDLAAVVTLVKPDAVSGAAFPPVSHCVVNYSISIASFDSRITPQTYTDNVIVPLTSSKDVDEGLLKWTTEWKDGPWGRVEAAISAKDDLYRITDARINSIQLYDVADMTVQKVLDRVPRDESGSAFLCNWEQPKDPVTGAMYVGDTQANYYAYMQAYDSLNNATTEADPEFTEYWLVRPDTTFLAKDNDVSVGYIGTIRGKDGSIDRGLYSAQYCDSDVANRPAERIGELGRVHSYYPGRSLRLWSAANDTTFWSSTGSESGHDAALIDLFKVGGYEQKRGKVNPNSLQARVINGLFAGTGLRLNAPYTPAWAVLRHRILSSQEFTTIGQVFGDVPALYGGFDRNEDEEAEEIAVRLAERLSVRQNFFTVIACAQTFRDIGGVTYSGGTAELGKLDPYVDGTGRTRYVDPLLAEQKVLAVIYRDAFSKKAKVCSVEYIDN